MLKSFFAFIALSFMLMGLQPAVLHAGAISYSPPDVGAPSRRVGAGVRGTDTARELPFIGALIPKTTGLTSQAQPTLYWTSDLSVNYPVQISLQYASPKSLKEREDVLFLSLDSVKAGVHAINLQEHNISLKPDVLYKWGVTVVVSDIDKNTTPAADPFADGHIIYQPMSKALEAELEKTPAAQKAAVYAKNGIWYDAVSTLSQQIEQHPENQGLKQTRLELMQQVMLPDEITKMLK